MYGLNQYDFIARQQDPSLGGRFTSIDPLAEKYYSWSPYVYCGNNPIRRTDPTGMDWYEDANGNPVWFPGDKEREGYTNVGTSYTFNNASGYIVFDQNNISSVTNIGATDDIWETQMDGSPNQHSNCKKACDKMLSNAGVSSDGMIIIAGVDEQNNVSGNKNYTKGKDEIENTIIGGNPILVGVDYKAGSSSADGASDHFVVISEMTRKYDKSGQVTSTFYRYLDPRIKSKAFGANRNNTLSPQNGKIQGRWVNSRNELDYTIISVRSNKK